VVRKNVLILLKYIMSCGKIKDIEKMEGGYELNV